METKSAGMESESRRTPAYNARYIGVAVIAALVIIAAALGERQFARGTTERIGFALAQSMATAIVVVMPLRALRHLDELQRRIQLEALALAFVGTGILCSTYGFLEKAMLSRLDLTFAIWPAMVLLWVVGVLIACRRYR